MPVNLPKQLPPGHVVQPVGLHSILGDAAELPSQVLHCLEGGRAHEDLTASAGPRDNCWKYTKYAVGGHPSVRYGA